MLNFALHFCLEKKMASDAERTMFDSLSSLMGHTLTPKGTASQGNISLRGGAGVQGLEHQAHRRCCAHGHSHQHLCAFKSKVTGT